MDANTTALLVALIALVATVINSVVSSGKVSKSEAVVLENRLTKLESRRDFTDIDRTCLSEVNIKMGLIWKVIEKMGVDAIVSKATPRLDTLALKAKRIGIAGLSQTEAREMYDLLEERINELAGSEDGGKLMALALFQGKLGLEKGIIKPEDVQLCDLENPKPEPMR